MDGRWRGDTGAGVDGAVDGAIPVGVWNRGARYGRGVDRPWMEDGGARYCRVDGCGWLWKMEGCDTGGMDGAVGGRCVRHGRVDGMDGADGVRHGRVGRGVPAWTTVSWTVWKVEAKRKKPVVHLLFVSGSAGSPCF